MQALLDLILSYVPRNLPNGMSQFNTWSDRIIRMTGPLADVESMRYVLASNILHLGPQASSAPDRYFIRAMKKGAANQVASAIFQDIKLKQAEQQKADLAKAAKLAEDTATQPVSNEKAE